MPKKNHQCPNCGTIYGNKKDRVECESQCLLFIYPSNEIILEAFSYSQEVSLKMEKFQKTLMSEFSIPPELKCFSFLPKTKNEVKWVVLVDHIEEIIAPLYYLYLGLVKLAKKDLQGFSIEAHLLDSYIDKLTGSLFKG